jgi:transposase
MGADRTGDTTGQSGGRRREVNVREVLNAIFYVLSTGCQWQALPKDLPPKSTAHSYFMLWDWDGTLERIDVTPVSHPGITRVRD